MFPVSELSSTFQMSGSNWLKLNVGGWTYETTRPTLTSCPGSRLADMFAEDSDRWDNLG